MAPKPPRNNYELLPRSSSESDYAPIFGNGHGSRHGSPARSWMPWLRWVRSWRGGNVTVFSQVRRRRSILRYAFWVLAGLPSVLLCLTILTIVFRPSYTHPPAHYKEVRDSCIGSDRPGRGNLNNETVFIAASVYDSDGTLAGGAWGDALLDLVDLLGPRNTFLSIYENDPTEAAESALRSLEARVNCNSSIVAEHLNLDDIPRVSIPNGEQRVKRIAYLAEVRNRALRPLDHDLDVKFDKLLYVNDVVFDPVDAVQLLFSTNTDGDGKTHYGAACAVDFINPFKFYDRFATRDLDGYSMGIPFYPWFTDEGSGASRQDVLDQKDAVRVRSCWGGMTAFEAKWFQEKSRSEVEQANKDIAPLMELPLRFRAENDTFWDASECCLIHADLQYMRSGVDALEETGIYMNPYIRVAYDEYTLSWLAFTRRPERLYSLIHNVLNHLVGFPFFNPRRTAEPGDEVTERVWSSDELNRTTEPQTGSYHDVNLTVGPGAFCGGRKLLLINEHPAEGESKWVNWPLPPSEDITHV